MIHPKTREWLDRLNTMFDQIDHVLEDRHAGRWRLRHNRPARGQTANPEADGLFNVGVFFDPGFGSRLGRGYLVEIIIATDEALANEEKTAVRAEVQTLLTDLLPLHFPERRLSVDLDGTMLKIHGDLSLGAV